MDMVPISSESGLIRSQILIPGLGKVSILANELLQAEKMRYPVQNWLLEPVLYEKEDTLITIYDQGLEINLDCVSTRHKESKHDQI